MVSEFSEKIRYSISSLQNLSELINGDVPAAG